MSLNPERLLRLRFFSFLPHDFRVVHHCVLSVCHLRELSSNREKFERRNQTVFREEKSRFALTTNFRARGSSVAKTFCDTEDSEKLLALCR